MHLTISWVESIIATGCRIMGKRKLRSIEDIARIAGVSKSTVSRALNDSPLIGLETRQRISAIAKEYGFRRSEAARSLSLKSSRTIAFVMHAYQKSCGGLTDLFSVEIMGGITLGLHELGYDMLVVHVDPHDTEWAAQYLDSGRVDGFILMTSERKSHHIDRLMEIGAPFIAWGVGGDRYCSVCSDNSHGGFLAAERLITTGKKRLAFIGGPEVETEVKDRYRGWTAALAEAGMTVEAERVVYGNYLEDSGSIAMASLLDRDSRLDGVFACSDLMAIGAIAEAERRGLRVPEDVAVVGYDDLLISARVSPALTTIRQNIPAAGQALAKELVAYLKSGQIVCTTLPVELVIRESA